MTPLMDMLAFANRLVSSGQARPEFARGVAAIIDGGNGFAAAEPVATTLDKIGSFVETVGKSYLQSVEAYYLTKGKIADLKLAAKGSYATQAINTAQGAISLPPMNLLLVGGLAVAALLIMRR